MLPPVNNVSPPRRRLARLGYGSVLVGLLFFTPLTDFLPVETLRLLQETPPHAYFKVSLLGGEAFVIQHAFARVGVWLVLCGIALIAAAGVGSRTGKP